MDRRRARRPVLLLTLLVALALHLLGAVLVLLLRSPEGAEAQSARPSWQEVELVAPRAPEVPRTVAPTPTPTKPPPRPTPTPATARQRRPRPPHSATAAGPAMSLRMRGLDLSPSPDLFAAEAPRAGPAPRRDDGATEAARVKARIDGWLKEDAGRRYVAEGRSDPALFTLLRRVQALFSPTEQMIPARARHAGREYLRAYAAGIEAYNKMGRAMPFDHGDYGQEVTPPKMLEGSAQINQGVAKNGSAHLITEICISTPRGARPVVDRQRASGSRAFDDHARRALETALARVDLPAVAACYRFDLAFGRSLPTPSLDYLCGVWSNPGGKRMSHSVRLVAAWPGE